MPKASELTKSEEIIAWRMRTKGASINEIALKLKRSKRSVFRILASRNGLQRKNRPGRPRVTSKRDDRKILNLASSQKLSLRSLKNLSGLQISKDTIHRRIRDSANISLKKMARKPALTARHKSIRVQWAKKHMAYGDKWLSVLFSDEKKWNLDGPDGWSYYWHDLRKEPRTFFSRQQGGKSLMVWGGFGFNGQTSLAFIEGKQNSEKYQDTLEVNLLPFIDVLGGPDCVFQQDNASIHVSNSTKAWLNQKNITVMDWPALSPDLNPIENLWGILTRKVYENGRQYSSVEELKRFIEKCWYEIQPEVLQKLVNSMEHRVFELISCKGNTIKY